MLKITDATRSVQDLSSLKSFERSMDLAKRWLQRCQTSHSICQSATKFIPTRVIDVGDKHFFHYFMKPVLRNGKDLPSGSRYLTLSHCWGMVVPIKLTTSNLSSMMESIPFHQLPKTFQDAIIVAQNLGVRYLWIDSLCIIQDSNKDWQHESALMAEVYRNGTCNLSAAQASDSSEGLFLKHNPGFTKLIKARFATNEKGFVMHGFWPENIWNNGLRGSPLMRRGWVLQERLISRCNIHFTRDQLLWECRDRTACETFPDQFPFKEDPRPQKLLFSRSLYGVVKASNSITDTWNFTVAEYTSCSLTYSTDKLPAFGGLAAAFSTFSGRTYLAGLWLENIAYQLCWSGRSATTASPYVAPSWSWASTEGAVRDTFLPVHTCIRQLDILEAHVDLVSENPYGQVSGGYLRVTGRLATAKIVHQERPTLLLPNVTGVYMDLLVTLSLSWNEARISDALQSSSPKFGVMYVLAVMERVDEKAAYMEAMKGKWEKDGRREARTRWLILCRVKNHTATFRRCGTFAVDGSYFDRFEQACKQFDNDPRDVPLHSYEEGYGAKYAITII